MESCYSNINHPCCSRGLFGSWRTKRSFFLGERSPFQWGTKRGLELKEMPFFCRQELPAGEKLTFQDSLECNHGKEHPVSGVLRHLMRLQGALLPLRFPFSDLVILPISLGVWSLPNTAHLQPSLWFLPSQSPVCVWAVSFSYTFLNPLITTVYFLIHSPSFSLL